MKRRFLLVGLLLVLIYASIFKSTTLRTLVLATTSGWAALGDNVFFTDGNVGVGVKNPQNLVHVVDRPLSPVKKVEVYDGDGEFARLHEATAVAVDGNYAYMTSYDEGFFTIMNISNPSDPVKESEMASSGPYSLYGGIKVSVQGNYAYVLTTDINATAGMTVIDISNKTSPQFVSEIYDDDGEFSDLSVPTDLYVSGTRAYITGGNEDSITVVDISDPSDPDFIRKVTGSTYMDGASAVFYASSGYTFVGASYTFTIWDMYSSASMQAVLIDGSGGWNRLANVSDIFVKDGIAYVTSFDDDALTIMDVSTISSPVKLSEVYDGDGEFSKLDGPISVYVSGNYAYVASYQEHTITIMDVSDPSNPEKIAEIEDGVGGYSKLGGVNGLQESNGYLFASARWDNALTIIGDITARELFSVTKASGVGVGTSNPKATLDVNGFMKLKKNSSAPATCNSDIDGAMAVSSGYRTCICKNGTGWVYTSDGSTSCSW